MKYAGGHRLRVSDLLIKLSAIKGEFAWVIAGQAVALAGALVGIKLLTNMMSQAAYGQLALGLSIAGLINMFLFGPLGQIILRYYSVSNERGEHAAYSIVLARLHGKLVLFVGALGLIVSMIVKVTAGSAWAYLTITAVCFGIASGLLGSAQSLFSAARNRKLTALSQFSDVWLRLMLAALLIAIASSEGYWALAGYAVGTLCVLLFQLPHLHRLLPHIREAKVVDPVIMNRHLKEFRQFGTPFVAFAGFAVISQYADRWLLQGLAGAEEVGIYAVLYQIASAPVVALVSVATQLIIPIVFSKAGALGKRGKVLEGQALIRATVIVVLVLSVIFAFSAYVWGQEIVALVANKHYASFANSLWIIVSAIALFNAAQILVASGLSLNRPAAYLWPKFAQALALLTLGVYFIPQWGVQGMSLALLCSSIVYFLFVIVTNQKLLKQLYG